MSGYSSISQLTGDYLDQFEIPAHLIKYKYHDELREKGELRTVCGVKVLVLSGGNINKTGDWFFCSSGLTLCEACQNFRVMLELAE